jgi:[DsrC]-trisulfide reductase subunit P
MIEKALIGSNKYYAWLGLLAILVSLGGATFIYQYQQGLTVTGLSRDIPWGLYISQLVFMVGIAASAVMVVLPYYLHDFKAFAGITILGEFVAVPAALVSGLFVVVDIGRPDRMFNLLFHPTFRSPIFWDIFALNGYLLLNLFIGFKALALKIKGMPPPRWFKPLVLLSIPWAFSIHTVTAFIYSGLAARPFWLSAILAPRFLASAFACGPALLILIMFLLDRISAFRIERKAVDKLAQIATYALITNIFFFSLELFTVIYSAMPHHLHPFEYLFFGLDGHSRLVIGAWISVALALGSVTVLLIPRLRKSPPWLIGACTAMIIGLWIDKGFNLIVAGFVPNPLNRVVEYAPTAPEVVLTIGIYALGVLIFTLLCKIYVSYFEEIA